MRFFNRKQEGEKELRNSLYQPVNSAQSPDVEPSSSNNVVEHLLEDNAAALGLKSSWSVRQALSIYRKAATAARGGNGALLMNARNPSTQAGAVALAYRASFVPAEGRSGLSRDALVIAMAKEISDVVRVGKLTVLGCYRKVLEPRMDLLLDPPAGVHTNVCTQPNHAFITSENLVVPHQQVGLKRKAGMES